MDGKLRNMTSVYLTGERGILCLYRIGSRVANHKYIGSAGGHFEKEELNDAKQCALREMREELNLTEADVDGLKLRYITLRLKNGEIRQNYYFFFHLKDLPQVLVSKEGILSWHHLDEIDDLPMPVSAKQVLLHYRSFGRYDTLLRGGMTQAQDTVFVPLTEF